MPRKVLEKMAYEKKSAPKKKTAKKITKTSKKK